MIIIAFPSGFLKEVCIIWSADLTQVVYIIYNISMCAWQDGRALLNLFWLNNSLGTGFTVKDLLIKFSSPHLNYLTKDLFIARAQFYFGGSRCSKIHEIECWIKHGLCTLYSQERKILLNQIKQDNSSILNQRITVV